MLKSVHFWLQVTWGSFEDSLFDAMTRNGSTGDHDEDRGSAEAGGDGAPNPPRNPDGDAVTAAELESFSSSADEALKLYDVNDDGYISFKEFAEKMMPPNAQHETRVTTMRIGSTRRRKVIH